MRTGMSWCGQCYASVGVPARRSAPVAVAQQHLPTYTRWRKTDTSFGPVGRVLWTVAMVLLLAMCLFSQDPFAIVAAVLVAGVVLRSVWKRSRLT